MIILKLLGVIFNSVCAIGFMMYINYFVRCLETSVEQEQIL